jgi:hypothetical protein
MAHPGTFSPRLYSGVRRGLFLLFLLALWGLPGLGPPMARAATRFDVFVGYDSVVPEASWFPVICEVQNDGPPFTATIEITSGNFNRGLTRRTVVELPTGTLKRLVIPVFSNSRYMSMWDARVLDERGHVRAEQLNLPPLPRRQTASETPLMGALTRTANGMPVFLPIASKQPELQPYSARWQTALLPDNPLVWEGMDSFYLNSEKAIDLTANQVHALLSWLNAGGHLIIGVEQVTDINSVPWLRAIFPCDLTEEQTVSSHGELQEWLRSNPPRGKAMPKPNASTANPFANSPADKSFEAAPVSVAAGRLRDGAQALVSAGNTPLIVTAHQGMGRITGMLFSPEREPVRSWKNLPTLWTRLAEVPPSWYVSSDFNQNGGLSTDGVFGAMIDSRQVRKLPVEWLLLLLILYLLVIGPLDQYWLKKIRRPMLTWITFPCYVALFSMMIYFIGYKLRAGETEWNELHLVDVLLNGDHAELRGRTYASVYSPVNSNYKVENDSPFATFRNEFLSSWMGGGQQGEQATVSQIGDHYKADIFVPVWTSQLFVSDWWQSADVPLNVSIVPQGSGWRVTVQNLLDRALSDAQLVLGDRVIDLGDLAAKQTKNVTVTSGQGTPLKDFVQRYGGTFQQAVMSRQNAFGNTGSGRIDDAAHGAMAASFVSQLNRAQNPQQNYYQGQGFVAPPGLDLSDVLQQGNAVVLAWVGNYSPIKPLNQFPARRGHRDTLWRMTVPVNLPAL